MQFCIAPVLQPTSKLKNMKTRLWLTVELPSTIQQGVFTIMLWKTTNQENKKFYY